MILALAGNDVHHDLILHHISCLDEKFPGDYDLLTCNQVFMDLMMTIMRTYDRCHLCACN